MSNGQLIVLSYGFGSSASVRNYVVFALPLSSITAGWTSNLHHEEWKGTSYAIPDDNFLYVPTMGVTNGPWAMTTHSFEPTWMNLAHTPTEIYIMGCAVTGAQQHMHLLSYRFRMAAIEDPSFKPGGQELTWRLQAVDSVMTRCDPLPFGPHLLANSGRFFANTDGLGRYSILDPVPQPIVIDNGEGEAPTVDPLADVVLHERDVLTVEPWSGAVVIGRPGLVRILRFD